MTNAARPSPCASERGSARGIGEVVLSPPLDLQARAFVAGGRGTTRARHAWRGPTTPCRRRSGKRGGGTMAARRAKHSTGVITRSFTRPRPAFFTRYETLPSRRSRRRSSENAGRKPWPRSARRAASQPCNASAPASVDAARARHGVVTDAEGNLHGTKVDARLRIVVSSATVLNFAWFREAKITEWQRRPPAGTAIIISRGPRRSRSGIPRRCTARGPSR
jgi:hypothetical protein